MAMALPEVPAKFLDLFKLAIAEAVFAVLIFIFEVFLKKDILYQELFQAVSLLVRLSRFLCWACFRGWNLVWSHHDFDGVLCL